MNRLNTLFGVAYRWKSWRQPLQRQILKETGPKRRKRKHGPRPPPSLSDRRWRLFGLLALRMEIRL